MTEQARITAVLGPTNTGKTHYAIDRMLAYPTGVIGLPLRLLAREVYDRIVKLRGPSIVALVTGEERIVPARTRYWVCTTEAMPEGLIPDFLAIDEVQLCADPERGHVFTDRLLRARGTRETLLLGSDTMRGAIAALVPDARFARRERFSTLTYTGQKKISRMPQRSAIVGFSVDQVYAIAELLRRQKGGAAVVMGALSPRTRNAQVELYQNGDVDYLVATDAIGMGLNLDIDHVAFSSLSKFDGRRMRPLQPNELAQIAGRAGRYTRDGTFGVTGEAPALDAGMVEAIEEHRFAPIQKLQWRNSDLEFGSVERLIGSLEAPAEGERLTRSRESDDLTALRILSQVDEVRIRCGDARGVRLLWDVCRIPDFRGISHGEHAGLLERIFGFLAEWGRVPDDWLARQVKRIDRTDGEIDTLSKRLAYIRTWTYVAQRSGWVDDETHWRGATRAVEDRLSDALHERLTQRFVDRRTSVLLRRLKQKESLVAEVNDKGEVTVEGQFVGRLEGFRFSQDKAASPDEAKTLRQASLQALRPEFHLRADRFYNAPDTEIDFTDQGGLMWGDLAAGKLVAGSEPLKPQVEAFVDEEAGHDVAQKVQRRLQHFIDRKIATLFEPLLNMQRDEALTGLARGFAFRLVEALGVIPRDQIATEVKDLDQDSRAMLRKHGVRFGQFTVFMPLLLKPAPTRLRLVLWGLAQNLQEFPESPPPGLVTIPSDPGAPDSYHTMSGYRKAGDRAIRIDMLERLADLLRAENSRAGFEATPDMLSITGMTLEQFARLMQGLGYKADQGERQKVKPVTEVIPTDAAQTAASAPDSADPDPATPAPDGAAEVAGTASDAPPAPDIPVMDAAIPPEGAITEEPAEPAPAETPSPADEAASLPDRGTAPIAETADNTGQVDDHIPDTPAGELKPGTEPDADIAGPETEVFYTFTWAGFGRRREGGPAGHAPRGAGRPGGKPAQGKPGGKPGGKPKGKRPPKTGEPQPRNYESRPPKKDRIDPDNPFAAALMGLRDKT